MEDEGIGFGEAFELLKLGKFSGMRLPSWKKDVIVRIQRQIKDSKMTENYLYRKSLFGEVLWKETYEELFSEKWELVK